ncbi:hypothetical protein BBJ28_00024901 [Nothophytophthora sp. Chile5]|nr:hypothetical protein BBJ28_00024901 [Nothophytophthora sp. Chile5]
MLEEGSEERAPAAAVKRLVRACYRAEGGDFAEDELLLREWLGFIPYEDFIRKNVELAVSKLYEISQKVEASQQKDPAKKGIRTFSLLPYSKSYAAAHIVINGTTLHGFCARIFKVTGGHNPLNIPLTGPGGVLIYKEAFGKQKELFLRRGFEISEFETMAPNAAITKQAFDAMDHDVKARFASRVFANQITTNGYSASVLLTRPNTTLELEIAEITNERKRKRLKGERTNETIDVEWYALPDDYETDMMVAIDPGMRTLCTAVSKGGISPLTRESANKKNKLSRVRRKRRKKGAQARLTKKHRRQLRKRRKISRRIVRYPREVDDQLIHSISTREYRHLAGMNKHRYWNENLRKCKHEYSEAISRIPSYKTASFDKYFARLHIFWKCVSFLIKFCAENAFLKWRFFVSRMKTKTLDALVKRLVPVASPRVLVGYGDWSRRDKITGHAPGPVKGFKRALKKRATVVPVDEFRTSKLCSCCHEFLEKALLPVKTEDGEFVLEETRNVLRCSSSACKATFWNRDVNAARNIFALLKSKLLGLSRPKAFRRA